MISFFDQLQQCSYLALSFSVTNSVEYCLYGKEGILKVRCCNGITAVVTMLINLCWRVLITCRLAKGLCLQQSVFCRLDRFAWSRFHWTTETLTDRDTPVAEHSKKKEHMIHHSDIHNYRVNTVIIVKLFASSMSKISQYFKLKIEEFKEREWKYAEGAIFWECNKIWLFVAYW